MNSYRYALVLCCLVVSSHAVASDWIEDTIEHGPYQIVVGDNVSMWQPGKDYHSGKDWLALRCTAQACKLDPATLTVHPESQQGQYDGEPTEGQHLQFETAGNADAVIIAWLKRKDAAWLKSGPLVTYASMAAPLKRPDSEGTFELAVALPDGSQSTLVPVFDQAGRIFRLQLRTPEGRQWLGQLGSCDHSFSTKYFLWAGDLDQDGQPDYLIDLVDNAMDDEGKVILFLSSLAEGTELVGIGASFFVSHASGECDGGGWLDP